MDLKEVERLGGDESNHWYYASKAHALRRCLADTQPEKILDVGAGSGFFSKMLLRQTTATSAICVDPGYDEDHSEFEAGKSVAFTRNPAGGDADLILLMDVLEHVDDDVGLLQSYVAPAPSGARFIVSVPAFSWLWSPHDEFLEHRRRYTLNQLRRVLSDAGLSRVAGFYFFAAIFPAVAVQRVWRRWWSADRIAESDLRRHHPLTNSVLKGICVAESAIAVSNRAFGLTVFGVAEKP
jgi:hypothetical protein